MSISELRKINIYGFKSIKECHIEFGKLNILIGSNGAGKSNFISVFTLLDIILKHELQDYIIKSGGANSFLFNGSKETNNLRCDFHFGENYYEFILSITDNDSFYFSDERFGYEYSQYGGTRISSGHIESKWEQGCGNNTDQYIIPVLKSQAWRVYHFHDTSRNASIKKTHSISDNIYLQKDASNLAAFLLRLKNNYEKHYNDIVKTIKLIAPYFSDFILEPTNNDNIRLLWRQVGSDIIFNANQFSDGTLRFICLTTLLLQPRELQPETIVIDEPELGLHPYAITVFSELVKKISSQEQIILSTQSVELLNEFEPKDIIVVDRNNDGSVFKRLNESELKEWLELEYSLGDLWKKNIIGGRLSK